MYQYITDPPIAACILALAALLISVLSAILGFSNGNNIAGLSGNAVKLEKRVRRLEEIPLVLAEEAKPEDDDWGFHL